MRLKKTGQFLSFDLQNSDSEKYMIKYEIGNLHFS